MQFRMSEFQTSRRSEWPLHKSKGVARAQSHRRGAWVVKPTGLSSRKRKKGGVSYYCLQENDDTETKEIMEDDSDADPDYRPSGAARGGSGGRGRPGRS